MELDCDICMEPFDSALRRPRLLPCGHTYCLACLLRMAAAPGAAGAAITCPEDRKAIPIHPNELVDNFYIMSRLDEISLNNKEPVRLWCRDCKSAAGEACEGARHRLQRLQEVRAARAAQAARQVEALERLGAGLRRAEEHCAAHRLALQDAAARLRLFISHSGGVGGVGPEWDRAWEEAQRGAQLLQAAEQVQPCPEKLDFREIIVDVQPTRDEKMTALVQPNVTTLTGVECNVDPVWTLALLVKHAMHLEELQLRNVHREHLLALQAMPRLRALDVQDWHVDLETRPVEFQEAAATSPLHTLLLLRDGGGIQDEDSGLLSGLRTLEADLPSATLQSLVRAHRRSLQSLRLWAGDASEIGGDLPALLRASGATRLQRLCLQRGSGPHCERRCAHQLAALRQDMPACRVTCTACTACRPGT